MGPEPPNLAWSFVLLLSLPTCGLFYVGWVFYQAFFIRKIDPASKALIFLSCYLGLGFISGFIYGSLAISPDAAALGGLIGWVCSLGSWVLYLVAAFDMRKSLLHYYNTVEPLSLRLSAGMTFFFSVFYFQFHFDRINYWKRTGRLR